MSNFMEKLAISKAIMDKHNNMGRSGQALPNYNVTEGLLSAPPNLDEFNIPQASYNIPDSMIGESAASVNIPSPQTPTKDRIINSKLPDAIKKLMLENPIEVQNPMHPSSSVLSEELVEKATKLMGTTRPVNKPTPQAPPQQSINENTDLRKMMKEVVKEVLKENGLLVESTSNTDEIMLIKVGKHIFEGKISRVKKIK